MKPRALDLFCGQGGATRGLQLAGFHVTGVDLKPQPRYCGEDFYEMDALDADCGEFDFIWASPPCQAFSAMRFMPTAKKHPDLISETRAMLVASGIPYCIENVEGAPLGDSGYLIMLCGSMFGLGTADSSAELRRHRLFETSFSIPLRPACQHMALPLGVYGGHVRDRCSNVLTVVGHTPVDNKRHSISVTGMGRERPKTINVVNVVGHTPESRTGMTGKDHNRTRQTFTVQQAREAMDIDWMSMAGLSQAVPPAYAEFIGRAALEVICHESQQASA
jgi:DNA (cytosine-5)-methyltransferase 1